MRPVRCSNRRTRASAAALLLYLAAMPPAHSECECIWEGSFADVQARADIVLAATVVRRKGNSVDIAIEELLRGDPYRDELRLWMETRDYCRPPADDFPAGTRWIMALKRIDEVPEDGFNPGTPNESFGRVGDYYLSSCGGYWLDYEGSSVTGNLVDAPRWAREVEMTPVMIDLLRAYIRGEASAEALAEASREDPALRDLRLDTRAFLRDQEPD